MSEGIAGRTLVRRSVLGLGQAGALTAVMLLALAGTAGAQTGLLSAEGPPGPDVELRQEAALAGYLCYGLMALVVVWGMVMATKWARKWLAHNVIYHTHMVLAVVALTLGWVHAGSYVLQTQEHFSVAMAVIPFVDGEEPEVAFGVIGLELALVSALSVLAIRWLNFRRFRLIHIVGAYIGFGLSWVHVLATSAEVKTLSLVGITVAAVLIVCLIAGVLRLLSASRAATAPEPVS
ncbi:hypothetical protein [Mycolicibacterium sp. HS_4_1]